MTDTYKMTVDLNVLDHLGINLYSNIAAVLTEAVANAWDADAENVEITIDTEKNEIEITDDGIGMSISDMNDKYLRVGYKRRDDTEYGKCTAKSRQVMGRKGLGKLSLFSIAEIIEIQSAKNDHSHGLCMSVDGIRNSVGKQFYQPDPLSSEKITVTKGTKITLRKIKRQRLDRGAAAIRKRLARRFSIIGEQHNFKITIDSNPITTNDRGDLSVVQFLWKFGDFEPDDSSIPNVIERERLSDRHNDWPNNWKVKGWIGTAKKPKELDNEDAGNLNGIIVLARGRLFHENILDKVNDGRLYTKYLTGQIEADFLDDDNEPDIATSDRQRVQEDDPRYDKLLCFLRSSLTQVEKRWTEWRRKHEVKEAKKVSPALAEWLNALPSEHRTSAEKLIAQLSALPIDEEEDRKLLYRHGILAFERIRIRGPIDELIAGVHDVEKLLKVLSDRDSLEASLYRDIVKSRLDVIKEFQNLVDENVKEKILQRYLFNHLWLLDPAWERATGDELMESRLTQQGVIVHDLTEKERLGRVDIAYRTHAGTHIIVELKKVDRKMKLLDLENQGRGYVDKLKKILRAQSEISPNIEVIFILGKPVDEESNNPDRFKNAMAAISTGSRVIHYDSLIKGARNAYSAYLEKSKEFDRIENILDQL